MSSKYGYTLLAAAAFALAGCGGGGGGYNAETSNGAGTGAAPPASTVTPFTPFVRSQFTNSSDTAEPANMNDQEWTFDEDETAYDDMLGS
jgi:hypothetical protein